VPNHILSHLSRADFRLLEPHLEAVDLPVRKQLVARNTPDEKGMCAPTRAIELNSWLLG
jgi:hypothetical protein